MARGKAIAGCGAARVTLAALFVGMWFGTAWLSPRAAEGSEALLALPIETHGFVSQGFILSSHNEYLAKSKGGSFEYSEAALNFTNQVTPSLRLGFQLLAHDLGPIGNHAPQFDWFYIDYRIKDWLGVRAGRIKMPFGLYNEVNDVDVARVPILLPQSIYQADHREYLFAQNGGEIYGDVPLGDAGALEYRLYGGGLSPDLPGGSKPFVTVSDVTFPYVYGARALWSTPLEGLVAGVSGQVLRLDSKVSLDPAFLAVLQAVMLVGPDVPSSFTTRFKISRWIASLQYAAYDWDLSAEYSRWTGEFDSPAPLIFPEHTVNERYYVMGSRRLSPWFSLGMYYSGYFVNVEDRTGHAQYQHDVALTTRYDLTENWLFKLEWHLMRGTAALDNPALNDGQPQQALEPFWGAFFAKTTAFF